MDEFEREELEFAPPIRTLRLPDLKDTGLQLTASR